MSRFLAACAVIVSCAASLNAATWACESTGNTYRECRIGTGGVIRLVMEMSERTCFEGLTWGTREGGVVWVDRGCRATFTVDDGGANQRIVCESQRGTREICVAETHNGVALVQQLSRTACLEFQNWGYDQDHNLIWVDQGCRGEFILGRNRTPIRSSSMLDGVVPCQSENGRRKECAADTTAGVQIVRNLNDSACRYNREWGWDAKSIWVTKGCGAEFAVRGKKPAMKAITCESDGARKRCPAETRYGVALIRLLSVSECALGRTWGFDADGVWVSEGCGAQFALGGYRLPPDAVPPTASKIVCESLDGKRIQCAADSVRGVGLVRQISETDCVLNRSWGYDGSGIWVTDGCRAEFAVAH
jgi:hypothetical protein